MYINSTDPKVCQNNSMVWNKIKIKQSKSCMPLSSFFMLV